MTPLLFFFKIIIFLLLLASTSINGDTDPSDASALMAMYQNLNSPGQLTKWSSSGGDPCGENWKGITCSGSRVTEIKLPSLGLSGGIGYQLSSLTSVTNFDVSNNNLGGQIPYSLPPNLQTLNLGGCGYTGTLPYSISDMASLKYLNVAHNQISGQLADMFGKLSALSTLDLSSNSFTGELPESFSLMSSATDMYLQNNQFAGSIDVLANLPLKNLNVANNKFTGWIPSQLNNINLQKDGNAFNSGPAAGDGAGSQSQPSGNKSPPTGGGGKKSGIGGGAIAGIVISFLVIGAIIALFLLKKTSKKRSPTDIEKTAPVALQPQAVEVVEMKPTQDCIDNEKPIDKDIIVVKKTSIDATSYSIADLQIATDSFSADNLIGEGSTGRVFRAQFEDGNVAAVKKINIKPSGDFNFLDIVSDVWRLRHPNVTELIGYCWEHGQHLLVYEFLKNGSLYDLLHDEYNSSKPLIWNSRVKIALGTARALEYLHQVCSPSVVHKNVKSVNILLDSDLNPHLSDSGLATLVTEGLDATDSALEVSMSGQYTIKSDVYGFGVTMLELLTGRKPFDSSRTRAEQSLVRWATPQLHDMDALVKMVDPSLKGLYPVKSLSRFADVIAQCVQAEPEFRPPMSEVVEALVRLVQRANMSKRTIGVDQPRSGSQEFM